MARRLLDTIAVSLLVLVVVGMAANRFRPSTSSLASHRTRDGFYALLRLGHGDVELRADGARGGWGKRESCTWLCADSVFAFTQLEGLTINNAY